MKKNQNQNQNDFVKEEIYFEELVSRIIIEKDASQDIVNHLNKYKFNWLDEDNLVIK